MSTRHGHRMVFPCPISSMPNELLLRMFQFLAADGSVSQKGARARIGHVCKQWRNVSRSHASLWTLITIDAVENDPRYGQYAYEYEEAPDSTFLRQSLYLSHPLPLDIRVTYTTCEFRTKWEYELPIFRILEVLTRYSNRWRTFEWTGPALFIDYLERLTLCTLKSRTLQSLTLRCNDKLPEPMSSLAAADITLGSGIKHVEVNFDMPSLQPDWSKLTSLTAGFTSASLCHSVLSRTTTLEILFLTHLGVVQDPPPSNGPGPTVLRSVRHLKVTPCAITGFLNEFRFPQIEELSISEPSKEYASHIRLERCPNNRTDAEPHDHVGILSTFLQKPGNSLVIRVLNVVWDGALPPLFRLLETNVKALRVDFRCIGHDARSFVQSLVISNNKPLLPNLSEIYIHESSSNNHFHEITQGEVLEDMILSRSALLRVLRLTSTSSSEKPNDFVQSSLCLTLQSLSGMECPADDRLDVEWVLGNFDILREGRDYARTLHWNGAYQ